MNVGILGGTFDPVHLGHLNIADAAMTQADLERVLLIPAGRPRLKHAEPLASVDQRLEMVRLAVEDHPRYQVCDIEAQRPGPTYTVDTLMELSAKLEPATNLYFILGMDVLAQLDRWKDPEKVLGLCMLLVLNRPGEGDFNWDSFYDRVPWAKGRVRVVTAPMIDVSATELRRQAGAGEMLTGQVPDAVAKYIWEQRLYLKDLDGRTES